PLLLRAGAGRIVACPPSTGRRLGRTWPLAGGAYWRFVPSWGRRLGFRRINRGEGQPAIIYLHPWELDPDQPRLNGPVKSRIRHYTNLGKTEVKLRRLLEAFSFGPVRGVLRERGLL